MAKVLPESSGRYHRFEDPERWAKDCDASDRDAWQRSGEVIEIARIKPGTTVADLGTGTHDGGEAMQAAGESGVRVQARL